MTLSGFGALVDAARFLSFRGLMSRPGKRASFPSLRTEQLPCPSVDQMEARAGLAVDQAIIGLPLWSNSHWTFMAVTRQVRIRVIQTT